MRTLDDLIRASLAVEITCGGCGRVGVYHALAMASFVRRPAASVSIAALERRLVCDGAPNVPGCGHRGASIKAIKWPPYSYEPARPKALTPAPAGVEQSAWDRADERERKRLAERARG